jgi:hypothetical protein
METMFLFTWFTTAETKSICSGFRPITDRNLPRTRMGLGQMDAYARLQSMEGVILSKVASDGGAFCNYELHFNIWRLFSVRRDAV